ncbi:lytic transglycosylase domain-containing protein [Desulfobotulus sp. H1]|uniref:Lytic transglycosylase domain-containing protein n=1 Tax=Desulfobotulus pelophilus TaxID=2823377 RepID=A0ABT3NBZ0_9BACT|nr:lytic transglycosylase domain-containing protein [Desulfobotulus pelophilus]MCW7754972.1 lytic transglycosylase domain-containing protein [Desulfobotulus pelophilus]
MIKREIIKKYGKVFSLVSLFCLFSSTCFSDIYMYVDEKGVVRFTNAPTSSRYKVFLKEEGGDRNDSMGPLTFYDENIKIAADYHGIDPLLVKAVVRVESSFNPLAVSPKGAKGLMQLMPSTIKDLGVKDPFNPRENIMAGTRYLRMMLDVFDQDTELALAAYNAGPSNVRRYEGVPPFRETQDYIRRVFSFWEEYSR